MTHPLNIVVRLEVNERIRQQQPAGIHHKRIYLVHLVVADDLLVQVLQPKRVKLYPIVARKDDRRNL